MKRYKCNSKKCIKFNPIGTHCIVEISEGSEPDCCPYRYWSMIQFPEWKEIKSQKSIKDFKNTSKKDKVLYNQNEI